MFRPSNQKNKNIMRTHLPPFDQWPGHARQAQFSCKLLAMRFGISRRQLERVFRRQFNSPPKLWLRRERMTTAALLLRQGHAVKRVAMDLHFRGADTFCRAFKKHFGQKPSFVLRAAMSHLANPIGLSLEFTDG